MKNKKAPKIKQFPRIYRFITEEWKTIFISTVSYFIVLAILIQGISLYNNLQTERKLALERVETEKELNYWKSQLQTYGESRDIYYKIATLEYKLGDKNQARENIQKAIELDPNFKEANVLGTEVGL